MITALKKYSQGLAVTAMVALLVLASSAHAADVIGNGTFDTDLNGWFESIQTPNGTRAWDNTVYGAASGSVRYLTNTGSRLQIQLNDSTATIATINSTDAVTLSFYYRKEAGGTDANQSEITVSVILPDGSENILHSDATKVASGQVLDSNVVNLDVSSSFTQNGTYYLKIYANARGGNNSGAWVQLNVDDIVLDVQGAANNAPTVTPGATAVAPSTVNRIGANTTTVSTSFSDADAPGVGAFNVTFKIREPNNVTELTLVNNQPNGGGGLTITDQGSGNYTASYTYNPDDAQTTGAYDLYFEVTDGTDNAIDAYADNLDELTIYQQLAPTITPSATAVSVSPVNRLGANTTVVSAAFSDGDLPGVGAFNVTFKIHEPNNVTELTIVNNQPNGGGGLTITDQGGGNYTASYTYDPADAQTTGLYDLYCEVTDGTDNVIDDYTDNLDELEINEVVANNAPIVTPGATAVAPSSVNRIGANTTTISTSFSDADAPGVGAFNVTFKVREPNNSTELTLVNNQPNGGGGLTITDQGGGNYTASYTYNPDDAQTTGDYDLYFEVSDGTDNVIDDYANNLDELEINEILPNNPPTIVAGAPASSKGQVNRIGSDNTILSSVFTDIDQPGVGAFTVTLKIREPNNSTELTLVNGLGNGAGGLSITDQGGGNYTASYTYNPDDAQTAGLYDIYFEVSDGTDNAIDGYTNNLDDFEIIDAPPNSVPTIASGATAVSVSPVNRYSTNTTVVSAAFSDADIPGVGAFTVTLKIREPNNVTELTLVNNQPNGGGGLTITDQGSGNYTASYTYDPDDAQTIGLYDLYCEVSDGTDNAIDDYTSNLNELEINEVIPPLAPTVVAGVTAVSVSPVNRIGSVNTVISADSSDANQPAASSFLVTFKVREPDNATELTLVNNLSHGAGGLTVTDNGGGSYTASYTYNPDDAQTVGFYDLFFEVDDGTGTANALDDYTNNSNELQINEILSNDPPVIAAGVTAVSISPVNRFGVESTVISATFTDSDQPGVNAFNMTFKIREPNNSTEVTLVNDLLNGVGGVTIVDNGGGSYTASYTYYPPSNQTLGLYDLECQVRDGLDVVSDPFANNLDELEIVEIIPNNLPELAAGATIVSQPSVNRLGTDSTVISASFYDADVPGVNGFTITFKVREPNNTTELVLVNAETNGNGGLTIIELGPSSGVYRAEYTWDPGTGQTLGAYDLYCEVSDGTDNALDDFANNLDELTVTEVDINDPPVFLVGATGVSPTSINRFGAVTTTISATFTDADAPGVGAFSVWFSLRSAFGTPIYFAADSLQNGVGGLTITDNGGGSYTASIDWDPANNAELGYYDLQCTVYDGELYGSDDYDSNVDELLVSNGGENIPPVVPSDNAYATPAGVERIGANPTTLAATFSDGDAPAVSAFSVTFKLRLPDNSSELVLVSNSGHGQNGVTISNDGGGVYTASLAWDPPDAQTLGNYDLYFHVTDGVDTSYDGFSNNLDELYVFDAISNNAPTLVAGTTFVVPASVNRIGTGYTMIKTIFSDVDRPGPGAFTITFKVRDAGSTEYTVVNAATNTQQGLRVSALGGDDYEAAVLWDPDVAQPTGLYDLYALIEDNGASSVADDYADNTDELTLTSAALLGDGYLLHRTNDADGCGGPNSACHNLPNHQGQDCRTCHTPHGTANIYLVRELITTPSSGDMPVIFKTLGIGDPYNDPDPTVGDPNSGVMADSTDNVFTGICEVCHRSTGHHRNDGSQPPPNHHDAEDCTSCHPHAEAFAVSGGGESSGGDGCSCHSSIVTPLTTSTTSYHHSILSTNADYTISSKTCLMCHVHHDIFRPDLNTGIGQRARNLRADITSTVVQGDATVLSNSDYSATGAGGICLSCHVNTQTKSFTPPDGSTSTAAINKSDFDAATSTHNYNVQSTYSDLSTFNANCVKCHNDTMTKSKQTSTNKFSTHDNPYGRILNPFAVSMPSDPLEEKVCFGCHSTTSNPNAGSNSDYYNIKTMTSTALRIEQAFGLTYTHPTATYSGRHSADEVAGDLADGNRHAECVDCHNVHGAQQGTHDGSSNLISNSLKGTWGVEPTSWPAAPVQTDNANVFAAPTGYTRVEPATKEYQICLKCHSNYTTLPTGARNLAEEINPNYPSTHGIVEPGTNDYCNTTTMFEPWGSTGVAWCSDCHRSDNSADPEGPHGSNQEHLLVATIVSDDAVGTPLCDVCHDPATYWDGSAAASRYSQHPSTKGAHQLPKGCFSCHMWDYAWQSGLGVQTSEVFTDGPLFVHGQNKRWVFKDDDGTAGSTDSVDAFVNGYVADVDYSDFSCWSDGNANDCSHSHNGTGY